MLTYLLMTLLILTAIFLIVLVLIQRGKGGGLAGAFGGMGGQSAFGTKAGDLFTKITVGVAFFWIVLCMVTVKMLGGQRQGHWTSARAAAPPASNGRPPTRRSPRGNLSPPAKPQRRRRNNCRVGRGTRASESGGRVP